MLRADEAAQKSEERKVEPFDARNYASKIKSEFEACERRIRDAIEYGRRDATHTVLLSTGDNRVHLLDLTKTIAAKVREYGYTVAIDNDNQLAITW